MKNNKFVRICETLLSIFLKKSQIEKFQGKIAMKKIFILLDFIVACTLYKSVFGDCETPNKYIKNDYYSNDNYYYGYRRRTDEAAENYDIFCNKISEISQNLLPCSDSKCKSVSFKMSNISTVQANVFMKARSLKVINLSNSGVRIIETGAFLGLLNLEEIHLEINDIVKITRGSLNSLISLRILNLSRNSIREIESESFHGSSSITHLDLSYNKLTSIPMKLIEPLTLLKSLNISNNLLISMNSNLCSKLLQLRYLNLGNNKIVEIEKCIKNLVIEKLSLSNNQISDLSNISFPNTLKVLQIDNNNISELNDYVFKYLSKLEFIDLSKNSINNYSSNVFRNIDQVKIMNISNNHLDHFDSADFSTLQQRHLFTLDISKNNISILQRRMFQNFSNLESLDISQNIINYIPLDVLSDLRNLKELNLSANKIEYLESGVFNELYNLKILDISNNSLMSLKSYIFFPLKNLQILNIAYNHLKLLQVTDIIHHCPSIELLDIDGNMFSCNELERIILLKYAKLSIKKGNTRISENVNGIACFETEISFTKTNGFGDNYSTNFFGKDSNFSFYKFFHNFSGFKQNTSSIITNNNTFWDRNELKDMQNSFQSFIDKLSTNIINKLKNNEKHEYVEANTTLLIAAMKEFLRNETMYFNEFLSIFSKVSNELKTHFANTVFNISSIINSKLSNNKTNADIPFKVKHNLNFENSSISRFVEKLRLIGEKLEEQSRRNTNKISNLTSSLQKEIELFIKFEYSSLKHSIYELSKNDSRVHESESPEELQNAKAEKRVTNLTETMSATSEIEKLIIALSQLKLIIILSIIFLMVIFSVKICRSKKSDYYQCKEREFSSLESITDKS